MCVYVCHHKQTNYMMQKEVAQLRLRPFCAISMLTLWPWYMKPRPMM